MLLLRLIVIFLILYIVLSVVKSALIGGRGKSGRRKFGSEREEEEMVLDPECQSYVPKSEAVMHSGKYFCSEECARRYLSR
jgi:Prokaryotic metallothionein